MRTSRRAWVWASLVLIGPVAAQAQGLHDTRGEALRLYAAGRFPEALPLFDAVLKEKPRDLDSLNKRGCIYIRMNQPERALLDLNRATRVSPFVAIDRAGLGRQFAPDVRLNRNPQAYSGFELYPSAFTNRGIALMMLGQDDAALLDFQRSISLRRLDPEPRFSPYYQKWRFGMASAYCGIGQFHHRKGDHALALDAYNRALTFNPEDANGHVGRGVAFAGLGRYDTAIGSYNEAIRLDPNHSRAFGYRAASLAQLGRDDAALADYSTSIRLDPAVAMTRRLRAALLSRLGRQAEALADLDAAIRFDPKDASAYKDRGGVYHRLGDPGRALRDLDESIRLDPRSAKAYLNRAAAHNGLAHYEEAVRDCGAALRLDPSNAGALNNRGVAMAGLGRSEDAIADLTESIRLDPKPAAPYVNRAGVYRQLGLYERAASDYDEAVRRDPGLSKTVSELLPARDQLRDRARSARDGLALQQPSVDDARQCLDRGNARRAAGDWPGAIAEFTRALEGDPTRPDAYALRGWSRLCAGEPGADADARSWFGVSDWHDPFAPYMALLGVLAARQDGRDLAASAYLSDALAPDRPRTWPVPVFRYLKGETTLADLLLAADDPKKQTEARAVAGVTILFRGDRAAALGHLRWVRDHGVERSIAGDLARENLRRADGPGPSPAPLP